MRVFTMQVSVAGNVLGVGEGHTKKAAQAAAALEALKKYYSED
jgi:dsRNA-specific ribonuclease